MRPSMRHGACIECRQRKVRCDGGQPSCHNCYRRGGSCVYTKNSGQEKHETLLLIKKLNERISHAERSIATLNTSSNPPIHPSCHSLSPSSDQFSQVFCPETGFNSLATIGAVSQQNGTISPDHNGSVFPGAQWAGSPTDTSTIKSAFVQPSELERGSGQAPKSLPRDIRVRSPQDFESRGEALTSSALHELYSLYFDKRPCGFFMMGRQRFMSRVNSSPLGPELLSLKYVVLAHGASISSEYRHTRKKFYDLARKHFEQTETGNGFVTIAALQACILLALYEINQLLFTRAWTSVSRAMWMAQMFGLDKMDSGSASPRQRRSRYHLSSNADSLELEDRRRAFWCAFSLCCFASTCTGMSTSALINYEEITTFLPLEDPIDVNRSPFRITLQEAFSLSGAGKLSVLQGVILYNALCMRCQMHADDTLSESKSESLSHDFWTHHYHITQTVNHVAFGLPADPNLQCSMAEHDILYMNCRIQAVLICLHHAAVMRFTDANVVQAPSPETDMNCLKAAHEVTNMTRLLQSQMSPSSQMSPYYPWSMYVAAQVFVRALHASTDRNQLPDTLLNTPTTQSFSPQSYFDFSALPGISSNGEFGQCAYATPVSSGVNSSRCSFSSLDSFPDAAPTNQIGHLESLESLLSALASLKSINMVAGVFESQIRHELRGGKELTSDRPIGRVDFPLDGQQMLTG